MNKHNKSIHRDIKSESASLGNSMDIAKKFEQVTDELRATYRIDPQRAVADLKRAGLLDANGNMSPNLK